MHNHSDHQGRWPVLRALLWKEWREQRWIFLTLTALAPAVLLIGSHWSVFLAVGAAGLVACLGLPLLLAANAFAGETDTQTRAFLDAMPCSRRTLYLAKFAAVCCLAVIGLAVLAACALPLLARDPGQLGFRLGGWLGPAQAAVLLMVLVLSMVTIVAWARGSVMATVVTALLVGGPVLGWCWYPSRFCHALLAGEIGQDTSRWLVPALAVLLLLAGTLLWLRPPPERTAARVGTVVLVLLAPGIAMSALGAGLWVRAAFFTGPEAFFRRENGRSGVGQAEVLSVPDSAAPTHLVVNLSLGWEGPPLGRAVLLRPDTGGLTWLSRAHPLWHYTGPLGPWSPNGQRCLLSTSSRILWPPRGIPYVLDWRWWGFRQSRSRAASEVRKHQVFDSATGTFAPLPEHGDEAWDYGKFAGWFDDRTLIRLPFYADPEECEFLDIQTGKGRICRADPGHRIARTKWHACAQQAIPGVGWVSVYSTEAPGRTPELLVRRYQPGLPEAVEYRVELPEGVKAANLRAEHSPDGKWLVLWNTERLWCVALADGQVRELAVPSGYCLNTARGKVGPDVEFCSGSRLLYVEPPLRRACILDVETEAREQIPIPETLRMRIGDRAWINFRLSPDRSRLVATHYRGRPTACTVLDLATRTWTPLWLTDEYASRVHWFGNDRLLVQDERGIWLCNVDGTGKRRLLPRE